jgi:hypothetical protein
MIRRRLGQQLEEQNWTAIGIEFVLRVQGRFLGIQAEQGTKQRSERFQERVHLERMLSDIDRPIDCRHPFGQPRPRQTAFRQGPPRTGTRRHDRRYGHATVIFHRPARQ